MTSSKLAAEADRGRAVTAMADGARETVAQLFAAGRIDAVIAMGGGAGTAIGTAAMRALPLGIPKVMVSTLASGDVRGFVGVKDIMMVPAIVDISGLNRISRGVFARAAAAVCGMVDARVPEGQDAPLITASMFGNTTKCVEAARAIVEAAGFEVLVFHAVGTGGQTMESLIEAGHVAGVLDVTTTEWADELVGGVMSAGPTRLEAAARTGTPAVIAPGCLDMVNFWEPHTLPEKYRGRRIYQHNPKQTLIRTDPAENAELGRIIAGKLNLSIGPVAVYFPLQGISVVSAPGAPYHWPEERQTDERREFRDAAGWTGEGASRAWHVHGNRVPHCRRRGRNLAGALGRCCGKRPDHVGRTPRCRRATRADGTPIAAQCACSRCGTRVHRSGARGAPDLLGAPAARLSGRPDRAQRALRPPSSAIPRRRRVAVPSSVQSEPRRAGHQLSRGCRSPSSWWQAAAARSVESSPELVLAFPVLDRGAGPREHHVLVLDVLGKNLSRVEVLDDFAADHRGEHEYADR